MVRRFRASRGECYDERKNKQLEITEKLAENRERKNSTPYFRLIVAPKSLSSFDCCAKIPPPNERLRQNERVQNLEVGFSFGHTSDMTPSPNEGFRRNGCNVALDNVGHSVGMLALKMPVKLSGIEP